MEEVITINIKTAMGRLHSELVRLECNFDDWVGEGSCGEWESEFYGSDREASACLRGGFEALNPYHNWLHYIYGLEELLHMTFAFADSDKLCDRVTAEGYLYEAIKLTGSLLGYWYSNSEENTDHDDFYHELEEEFKAEHLSLVQLSRIRMVRC